MLTPLALLFSALLALLPALYSGLATTHAQTSLATLRNKRICLLIAHPDDEAMFFAPTVLALARRDAGNHVRIVCLSSGDADGLGETRKRELGKSAVVLGLRAEEDVQVIESVDFPDSMTTTWDPLKISLLLSHLFISAAAADPAIDVLITFDQHGISAHPNHISLYHGAQAFLRSLTGQPPVALYTLTTVGMLRKYAGFSDAFTALAARRLDSTATATGDGDMPRSLLYISPFSGADGDAPSVARARNAMTQAHVSQMRWFRWGWITLSRYMYLNELVLANPGYSPGSSSVPSDTK
ncbi:hypothetical protein TD95_005282 [Thielaviopsis punctulata]|uniref:N-acetylglucosaminylphosphatidylinositol deacetylase n=1 Tax=Thielaviopsis punctulata TaxID=72032 RepID=A0A0F4ZHK1_9PEZI|nr:hypothetical protein TD95_005282 [Thielaviopsis punctulata]